MAHEISGQVAIGASMTAWTAALHVAGEYRLAASLDQEKIASLQNLERLGLPHGQQIVADIANFLGDPDSYLDTLHSEQYMAVLTPRKTGLPRPRQWGLNREQVVPYIQETLPSGREDDYGILIIEFFTNVYAGNIVVEKDGQIWSEFLDGSHNPLVGGTGTPKYFLERDAITGLFRYSFDDPDLRKLLFATVMTIPHRELTDEDSESYGLRRASFVTGYYEFVLAHKTKNSPLGPLFLDYSNSPPYKMQS